MCASSSLLHNTVGYYLHIWISFIFNIDFNSPTVKLLKTVPPHHKPHWIYKDSAISYMQMTSYRINVCYATCTVPVEIPHLKYQISFKNTICDGVINKYYNLQHKQVLPIPQKKSSQDTHLETVIFVSVSCMIRLIVLPPLPMIRPIRLLWARILRDISLQTETSFIKIHIIFLFFPCASYKHRVSSIDWFLKTRLLNRHAKTYTSQFTIWFPSISSFFTEKACQSYWIRNSNIWHNLR